MVLMRLNCIPKKDLMSSRLVWTIQIEDKTERRRPTRTLPSLTISAPDIRNFWENRSNRQSSLCALGETVVSPL